MSETNQNKDIDCMSSKIDLKLDLSSPVLEQMIITTTGNSSTSSPTRCRDCYLYVLLEKDNLRCPKCEGSNFIEIQNYSTKSNKKSRKN
ncbi:hypothetical protein MKX03_020443 [Papaver bracteatum]|nr:hypothetical protein MKX03_020443 [Papaver bracteatum]